MNSYNHDGRLWQNVFLEMESTINIAQQLIPLEHATMTDPNQVLENTNEVRIARLTFENIALHNSAMDGTPENTHSVHSFSSFEWGQPAGRSIYHITISSEPADQLQTIRVGPLIGPPCTQCMVLPAVSPRRIPRILCYRCIQDTLNVIQAMWWAAIFPQHLVLSNPIIVPRIVEVHIGHWPRKILPLWTLPSGSVLTWLGVLANTKMRQ